MKINSTELQNNFGKYLMLAAQEDIIITRNGTEIATLTAIQKNMDNKETNAGIVYENAPQYSSFGKRATLEEFQQLQQESEERYEYIDGEIYLLASPKTAHQMVVTELIVIFHHFLQGTDCTPIVAPYDIELKRTPDHISVVQPDLMIICDLEANLNEADYYKGIPSLVVEVLSKSTRRIDLIAKLDLYMACGVNEYWIVNPDNKEITIYHFEDCNISNYTTYKNNEFAQSFIFDGLHVELERIFRL